MSESIAPPPGFHQLLEGRLLAEASWLLLQLPTLRLTLPAGSGPVMVLPGFMADDTATWLLRHFLSTLGYQALPWEEGVNRGPLQRYLRRLGDRLEALRAAAGAPASLVGWSRGGVLARELARDRPDLVRSIVTLGSPVGGGIDGTRIGRWMASRSGISPAQVRAAYRVRQRQPIHTPITAIYSRTDGVVSWRACRDEANPRVRHLEVESSHLGLVVNGAVYRLVAKALAPHHPADT